jgi:tRNA dimethylallyltransferase
VRGLLEAGYHAKLPAMSGIGYRQLAAYLNGDTSFEQAVEDTKNLTHDFIRRQQTWFRGHDNGILWHNSMGLDEAAVIDKTQDWIDRPRL